MVLRKALLYWHTVRHLRFEQIWFRGRRIIRRTKFDGSIPVLGIRPRNSAAWIEVKRRKPTVIGPGQFRFMGEEGSLADIAWDGEQREKLWRYNQHYFDDLNARGAESRAKWHIDLITDWLDNSSPPRGTGWEPYPASLRIVNWVKWCLNGNPGNDRMHSSLALQARWVASNIEFHLLGNHLISNAKALVFAGCFFEGKEADQWRVTGLNILRRELEEQILGDGGNFERSPMYHALGLEDVLDLINLATTYPALICSEIVADWRLKAVRMSRWLATMTHPDGELAMFNDAAQDVALETSDLASYAGQLNIHPHDHEGTNVSRFDRIIHLRDSGYVRINWPEASVFLDVAPLGPDYLPAHGHADTLSFELSLFAQRVIVNGGTSCYGTSSVRAYERGTAAHSTMVIDGADSSEVWGGFRVARRAYPVGLEVSEREDFVEIACSHNGYRRLKGGPIHRRSWKMQSNGIEISDTISGTYRSATSKFLLHHSVVVSKRSDRRLDLRLPTGRQVHFEVIAGKARLETAAHALRFGEKLPTTSIHVDPVQSRSLVRLSW